MKINIQETFQAFSKTKRNSKGQASYTEGKSVYKKSLREMRNGNKRREWEMAL